MSRKSIKYTCILTIFILTFYSFVPLFLLTAGIVQRAEAASLDKDSVYRGILLALLLILVSKIGQATEVSGESSRDIVIDRPELEDGDLDLLARVIYAEARGEPFQGQVAVGAVVLNRLKSPEFPNTIRGVIYQSGQFSSVDDGQINLTPNSTSYQAAREALRGNDPSRGALYFYNPDKAKTLWWLSTREITVRIGNHVFAK